MDKIIFATGFDALTGSILKLNITGKKGINLSKFWSKGPKSFLGLLVPNFPNLFIVSGPGSPSVLTNVPVQIEQHVNWITNCIRYLEKNKKKSIETTNLAAKKWQKEIMNSVKKTLFMKAKSSWYKGDNIPGKPKTFLPYPGGMPKYKSECIKVEKNKYKELKIS